MAIHHARVGLTAGALLLGVLLSACHTTPAPNRSAAPSHASTAMAAAPGLPPDALMPPARAEVDAMPQPIPAPAAAPAPPSLASPPTQPAASAPSQEMAPAASADPPSAAVDPTAAVLAFADRTRSLSPAERAREIVLATALASANDNDLLPARQLRLAIALAQTRAPNDLVRALQLSQQVAESTGPDARPLLPLARLLATGLAEQRRLEEQIDKLNHAAREQQRRIEQLTARLEAVRAIERSMAAPPAPLAPPATSVRPGNGAAAAPAPAAAARAAPAAASTPSASATPANPAPPAATAPPSPAPPPTPAPPLPDAANGRR
ncbi:MAG: hypothetical protein ABI589_08975 [Burkholderiales bacterium]